MKRLVNLLALALVSLSAFAQFSYGIKGGANLADMEVKHPGVVSDQSQLSFHFGLYGIYYVNEKISINPEFLFSNKGFRAESPSSVPGGGLEEFDLRLSYLSLPILIGYHPWKKFSVHVGPELSYRLASQISYATGSNDAGVVWDRRSDVGAVSGLNYLIGNRFDITFRYIHGLIDVVSSNFTAIAPPFVLAEQRSKNRVFQLSAGYRLN